MATLGLLKTKLFWDYGGIIPVYDITKKTLSCGSSYVVNIVMWLKSGNSSISMREVIITSIL